MDSLPEDLLRSVFKTLNPCVLCRLSCVSKNLRAVADDTETWIINTTHTKQDVRDIVSRAERALIHSACMWSEVAEKSAHAQKSLIERARQLASLTHINVAGTAVAMYKGPFQRHYPLVVVAIKAWMSYAPLREETCIDIFESEIFVRRTTFECDTFRLRNVRSALKK